MDKLYIYFFFQGLTKEFQIKDDNQVGKTEITYEDFLEMVFSCGPLFSYSWNHYIYFVLTNKVIKIYESNSNLTGYSALFGMNYVKNILPQIRLFFLVRPSSHPYTAHSFISELFDPILPHIQLI